MQNWLPVRDRLSLSVRILLGGVLARFSCHFRGKGWYFEELETADV